jgi:6-pyruvoyl-tetrahydropterin synthase
VSQTAIADDVHVATIHRADAPIGRTTRFHMHKVFDNFPCCRRSWAGPGKSYFLHGYERTFEVEFACAETEPDTGFVVDYSCLRTLRAALEHQFDHTTLIAADDPQRDLFELLGERGVIDLRIMPDTGMESSAVWVFEAAERIVAEATEGRVWVSQITARESRNNAVTLTAANGPD